MVPQLQSLSSRFKYFNNVVRILIFLMIDNKTKTFDYRASWPGDQK